MSDALPWMGLGLSSNLDRDDAPHPYRLLERSPGLFDYLEYSAPVDLEDARTQATLFDEMWQKKVELPVLFHPVHFNLYGPELEAASHLSRLAAHARAVGSPWVSNDVAWWHKEGEPFPGYLYLPPPLTPEGLADCAYHVTHARELVERPLLLENPTIVAQRGELHVLEFMAKLGDATGCSLLLDLGHLWGYQLSRGLPVDAGFGDFPWGQVVELHLAGGILSRRGGRTFFVDDHTQPVREELFELLETILPKCTGLRALTFEGDGHPEAQAERTLRRLRPLLAPYRGSAKTSVRAESGAALLPPKLERAWDSYNAAFRPQEGSSADVEGTRVEEDFRLALLAQTLDRIWPLTRLLVAGSREGLIAFSRSVELEAVFRAGGTVTQAFAAFARRQLLGARSSESAASVLSFEMWAISLAGRAQEGGQLPGWAVGTFPVDLSELQFCALALRRHLSARAWATGEADLSGLEAVAQASGRAERRPWMVAARMQRGRLEVVPFRPTVARGFAVE